MAGGGPRRQRARRGIVLVVVGVGPIVDFLPFRGVPFVPFASRNVQGVGTLLNVFKSILEELVSEASRDSLFLLDLGAEVSEGQGKLLV